MIGYQRTPKMRDQSTLHRYASEPRFKELVDLIAHPIRRSFEEYVKQAYSGAITPALQHDWDQTLLYCADIVLNIELEERARCVEEMFAAFPDESTREYGLATRIADQLMSKIRPELSHR